MTTHFFMDYNNLFTHIDFGFRCHDDVLLTASYKINTHPQDANQ